MKWIYDVSTKKQKKVADFVFVILYCASYLGPSWTFGSNKVLASANIISPKLLELAEINLASGEHFRLLITGKEKGTLT